MWRSPLGVSRWFMHTLPDYPGLVDLVVPAEVPNTRNLGARVLTISRSPWLRDADFQHIVDEIRDVLQRGN